MSAEETVFVSSMTRGGGLDVYHTDEECQALKRATTYFKRRRSKTYGLHECSFCSGAWTPRTNGGSKTTCPTCDATLDDQGECPWCTELEREGIA